MIKWAKRMRIQSWVKIDHQGYQYLAELDRFTSLAWFWGLLHFSWFYSIYICLIYVSFVRFFFEDVLIMMNKILTTINLRGNYKHNSFHLHTCTTHTCFYRIHIFPPTLTITNIYTNLLHAPDISIRCSQSSLLIHTTITQLVVYYYVLLVCVFFSW
jgi:hypothetical protein